MARIHRGGRNCKLTEKSPFVIIVTSNLLTSANSIEPKLQSRTYTRYLLFNITLLFLNGNIVTYLLLEYIRSLNYRLGGNAVVFSRY